MRNHYRYLSTGGTLEAWQELSEGVNLASLFPDASRTIKEEKDRQKRMGEEGCNILQLDSNFNPIRII